MDKPQINYTKSEESICEYNTYRWMDEFYENDVFIIEQVWLKDYFDNNIVFDCMKQFSREKESMLVKEDFGVKRNNSRDVIDNKPVLVKSDAGSKKILFNYDVMAGSTDNELSCNIDMFIGSSFDNEIYINYSYMMEPTDNNMLINFYESHAYVESPNVFVNDDEFVKQEYGKELYVNSIAWLDGQDNTLYVDFNMFADGEDNILYISKEGDFLSGEDNHLNMRNNDCSVAGYDNYINYRYNDTSVKGEDNNVSYLTLDIFGGSYNNELNMKNSGISAESRNKVADIYDRPLFSEQLNKTIGFSSYDIMANKGNGSLSQLKRDEMLRKKDLDLDYNYVFTFLDKKTNDLRPQEKEIFGAVSSRDLVANNELCVDRYGDGNAIGISNNLINFIYERKLEVRYDDFLIQRDNDRILIDETEISLSRNASNPIVIDDIEFLSMYDRDILVAFGQIMTDKDYSSLIEIKQPFMVDKDAHGVMGTDSFIIINKDGHGIIQDDVIEQLYRESYTLSDESEDVWFDKSIKYLSINRDLLLMSKSYKKSFLEYETLFLSKGLKKSSMTYKTTWVSKAMKHASIAYRNVFIQKGCLSGDYDRFVGLISKGAKGTSINDEYVLISKDGRGLSDITSAFDVWLDKNPKSIFSHDSILGISKAGRGTSINDHYISFDLSPRGVFEYGNLAAGLDGRVVSIDDEALFASIGNKGIYELYELSASKRSSGIQDIAGPLELYKDSFYLYEEDTFLQLGQAMSKAFFKKNVRVSTERESGTFKDSLFIEQYMDKAFFDRIWFVGQGTEKASFEKNVLVDQKIKHACLDFENMFVTSIPYDNMEKPDLKVTGIIDELIMPHKDYKYSDFLSKLLNPDGTINFKYVKSFDSSTGEYTITIPVEHPIDIYSDLARDYIDVDVSVLELVIYAIRDIWQKNMFRYVAMSAQDSLKDILKTANVKMYKEYGVRDEQYEEAKRCLQLFRWYSEMAILNNCDYILKFNTRSIEADFFKKELHEFEDIVEFENMHISDGYVLETMNPEKPCKIEFYNRQKNAGEPLNIMFKLYNINSNSSISIIDGNDVKIMEFNAGMHDVSIEVKDKAVLEFTPENINQSIALAQLKSNNFATNSFTVTYKGIFGETNKVMQELLDKALVVGEISAEVKEKYGNVAPVTVAIDRIREYFEIHHQDKVKGKRLITKK